MSAAEVFKQLDAMEDFVSCEAETHCEQTITGKLVRIEKRHKYEFGRGWSYGVWFVDGEELASADLAKALFGVSQS